MNRKNQWKSGNLLKSWKLEMLVEISCGNLEISKKSIARNQLEITAFRNLMHHNGSYRTPQCGFLLKNLLSFDAQQGMFTKSPPFTTSL